jgi:hypothetical protein
MECYLFNNQGAIPNLVDLLETNLCPYVDKTYERELKDIMETGSTEGDTPNQIRANAAEIENCRIVEKHRALMRLAHRNMFLPSASTGHGGA